MKTWIHLAERGLIPTFLLRIGIRHLIAERIAIHARQSEAEQALEKQQLIEALRKSPIALHTEKANEQHYEVPALFFQTVLGSHLKYSSGLWNNETRALDEAEANMLSLSTERAQLQNGMEILELGCGWGSLSLWMAARYPESRITALSNSHSQRQYIEAECQKRNLKNLCVLTCDINQFQIDHQFDRVVSVEMFEHLRNYQELFSRIAGWLKPEGKLFVHIFSHRQYAYPFETEGDGNWMGRYFFTGGIMPSADLFHSFPDDLTIETQWWNPGTHYQKTALAWLNNTERHKEEILRLFSEIYGPGEKKIWYHRWRIFFLACAELFGYRDGSEWGVSHYLFRKTRPTA